MKEVFYAIAGHTFRLSFSEPVCFANRLENYDPFRVAGDVDGYLFHLSVTDGLGANSSFQPIGQFDDDIASIGVFKSAEGSFRFHIAYPGSMDHCIMESDSAFRSAQVILPRDAQFHFFCLNNCLMLLYAFSTANHNTLLMHASVVKNRGEGFVFLGKSGTGKSTHSALWLEHIDGSGLLNDDNPVIRIIDDKAYVFGSPWSGKTPCYKNESVPLKGIVKLRQAPRNSIKRLSSLHAYAAILPACSSMSWEEGIASGIHRTVEMLATESGCYLFDCLPDQAAAELCCQTVKERSE